MNEKTYKDAPEGAMNAMPDGFRALGWGDEIGAEVQYRDEPDLMRWEGFNLMWEGFNWSDVGQGEPGHEMLERPRFDDIFYAVRIGSRLDEVTRPPMPPSEDGMIRVEPDSDDEATLLPPAEPAFGPEDDIPEDVLQGAMSVAAASLADFCALLSRAYQRPVMFHSHLLVAHPQPDSRLDDGQGYGAYKITYHAADNFGPDGDSLRRQLAEAMLERLESAPSAGRTETIQ